MQKINKNYYLECLVKFTISENNASVSIWMNCIFFAVFVIVQS